MKKQVIEIEVPDGKKAVWKYNKVVFEDIKPKLPKTWEEFCELYPKQEGETYIEEDGYLQAINIGSSRCEILDKNIKIEFYFKDGDTIRKGDTIAKIEGNANAILKEQRDNIVHLM